jgi:hypothetical protein
VVSATDPHGRNLCIYNITSATFLRVDIINAQSKIARLQPPESRKLALPSAFPCTRSSGRERKLHYIILSFLFSMAVPAHSAPWSTNKFRNNFFRDGRTPWTVDQLVARPLSKHRSTQTQNKRIHTPLVGFEVTIPASERTKTIHALDRAATVTGLLIHMKSTHTSLRKSVLFWESRLCVFTCSCMFTHNSKRPVNMNIMNPKTGAL